jgi:hypothetical protein
MSPPAAAAGIHNGPPGLSAMSMPFPPPTGLFVLATKDRKGPLTPMTQDQGL